MNTHGGTVASLFLVRAKCLNYIRFPVIVRIPEGRISSILFRKPGLDINVTVIIYSDVPCASLQTIDDNNGLEIVGKEQFAIIRVTRRKVNFLRATSKGHG